MDVFCTVIDIISVCGSIPIEIPMLWPRAVMVGPRPRVLLTLPLHIGFWWGNLRERKSLEDVGVYGRVILKLIFMKWDGGHGLN